MRDGRTVKRESTGAPDTGFAALRATLVVLEGPVSGAEHRLLAPRVVLGRGPDADIVLTDEEISQRHAAVQFVAGGFRVIDLGSTNGIGVNGDIVQAQELEHGDRLQLGQHVLQLVLEKRDAPPPVYVLTDE